MVSTSAILSPILFVLGITLTASHFDIDKHTKASCDSNKLRRANKGLLVIGILFMCLSLGMFSCQSYCDCSKVSFSLGADVYVGIIFLLSITLIVISSIIKSETNNKCLDEKITSPNLILITSILSLLVSLLYIGDKLKVVGYVKSNMGKK